MPRVVVQKVLRHRDPKLTEQVYGHLADDFLRDGVDRLHFEGMPEPQLVTSWALASGSGTPAGPSDGGSRSRPLVVGLSSTVPALLTVREVARRLGVRPITVYRLCDRRELAHLRVSKPSACGPRTSRSSSGEAAGQSWRPSRGLRKFRAGARECRQVAKRPSRS